jgi:hypothetical protein
MTAIWMWASGKRRTGVVRFAESYTPLRQVFVPTRRPRIVEVTDRRVVHVPRDRESVQ